MTTFSWLQLLIAWISFNSSSMLGNKTSDKSPIPKVYQPRIPFLQIDSFDGTSFIAWGAQCCLHHGSCAHPYHLLQLVVFGLKKNIFSSNQSRKLSLRTPTENYRNPTISHLVWPIRGGRSRGRLWFACLSHIAPASSARCPG